MIGIPEGHPLLDRVIADAADPAEWHATRSRLVEHGGRQYARIGASDAAKYAKPESVEGYVRAKLLAGNRSFTGNDFTSNGHAYEPALMAWAGVAHNTRMFAHPYVPWRAATPDGVEVTPTGFIVLGEGKVKHHIVTGPNPSERRQVVFAQHVMGAELTKWVWLHVHPDTNRPVGDPHLLRIDYDPDILGPLLPIADAVAAAVGRARAFDTKGSTA